MKKEYIVIGVGSLILIGFGGNKVIDLKNASENEKKYAPFIRDVESKYNIPTGVLHKLLKTESSFKTSIINGKTRSKTGALGIAQFMPATAKEWLGSVDNALNPTKAIDGAGKYLKWLHSSLGGWTEAVAAYNWGIGNVKNKGLAKAPLETRNYIKKIIG